MKIRPFEKPDLAAILAIQEKNPQAAHWAVRDYERLADDPKGMILVGELETMAPPKVLGFALFHRVTDAAELLNMAIDPEHHQQGVGRALLEEARKLLLEAGVKRVFLEVRQSNKAALGLYYSVGFGLHALRKDYYHDPPEHAYVLSMQLFPPSVLS